MCFVLFSAFIYASTDDVVEEWGIKKVIEGQDLISPMALQRDRPRAVLLNCYLVDDAQHVSSVVQRANTSYLKFYIDYTALFNTKVRFHFIFTGPEYKTHDTTSWYDATVNTYSWVSVEFDNPMSWKKGTYSLVVIAEQKILGAGDDCVVRSVFKLY